MTVPFLAAGLFTNLYRAFYGTLNEEQKESFFQGILFGGIAGAVCAVPMVILAINQNQKRPQISPLFWVNVGAGALGGFILGVPCGIGTFLYVLGMKKH